LESGTFDVIDRFDSTGLRNGSGASARYRMASPVKSTVKAPSITRQDGVTVIAPGREYEQLNDQELEALKTALSNAVSQAEPPVVLLDLSNMRFFGSAFIEALFRAWGHLNARPGGQLSLCGLTDYCREVVDVTHLDRLWTVFETRDEAVRSLRRN
jgi:anti-sigma B factor antagonist